MLQISVLEIINILGMLKTILKVVCITMPVSSDGHLCGHNKMLADHKVSHSMRRKKSQNQVEPANK